MASFLYKADIPQNQISSRNFYVHQITTEVRANKFYLIVKVITKHENSMLAFMENAT